MIAIQSRSSLASRSELERSLGVVVGAEVLVGVRGGVGGCTGGTRYRTVCSDSRMVLVGSCGGVGVECGCVDEQEKWSAC